MEDITAEGEAVPTVEEVLDALLGMARRSPRGQAFVDAALHSAGIKLSTTQRDYMVEELLDLGLIENVVPLGDGGVAVTVKRALAKDEAKRTR